MVRRKRTQTRRVKFGARKGAYKTIRGHKYKFVGSSSHQAAGNMEDSLRTRYSRVRKTKDKYGVNFWGSKRR